MKKGAKKFRVKPHVLSCLEHIPATRNSDKVLILSVWWNFYKEFWKYDEAEQKWYLPTEAIIDNVPPPESIRRSRQHIQNVEHLFPPSDEVYDARQENAQEISASVVTGAGPDMDILS